MVKLAIEGGKPVRKKPMPERVMFDDKEVKDEKEFARYFRVKFATAVSSGTAAVHSAIASLDLEPGSEVITTPITDPGTVMPIIFQGLIPVFADVDFDTLNITPETIEKVITDRTKAVIPVHLAGVPCEMDEIMKVVKKYKLKVIEDCAQAHGSIYKNKYVGTFGDMGVFSLMSGKHMTSGGQGGMVITDKEKYYWVAKRFADRGKPFGIKKVEGNVSIGLNYRMTEIDAIIGRIQLKKLKKIADKRYRIVEKLRKEFLNLKAFSLWKKPQNSKPNYWFCFVKVEKEKLKVDKWKVAEALKAEGIPASAHYVIPMYENPFIKKRKTFGKSGYPWNPYNPEIKYRCPVAEKSLNSHITLHIHECFTEREIEDILKAFEKVEKAYIK